MINRIIVILLLCTIPINTSKVSITRKSVEQFKLLGKNEAKGVVNPVGRCGGVGTPRELRISDCDGFCQFHPGRVYNCEMDFMPSSAAPGLSLLVEICTINGLCFAILEAELPNSSVQPGFVYTSKYSIVPNDVLSGQTVMFRAYIYQTISKLVEICVAADVYII